MLQMNENMQYVLSGAMGEEALKSPWIIYYPEVRAATCLWMT